MALKAAAGATWWLVRAWLIVVMTIFAGIALATPLPYDDAKGKYSFEIGATDEEAVFFELKGATDIATATVFSMSKPERIIIDLPTGRSLNWFRNIVVQKGNIERLRVGSHDSKVRFVLDLSRTAKGAYDISNAGGVLRVTVRGPETKGPVSGKGPVEIPTKVAVPEETSSGEGDGEASRKKSEGMKIPATFTPESLLSPTPTRTLKSTLTATAKPTLPAKSVATPLPTDTPMPTVEELPTATPIKTTAVLANLPDQESEKADSVHDSTQEKLDVSPAPASIEISPTPVDGQSNSEQKVKLLSLGYEMSDKGEPCLRLKFSRVVSYQMVRSSQDLFVVTVDNVALQDSSLSLAHFPPAAFSRFVSARAQSEKDGVKIFIYIEDGSYLLSIPKASEIWLKAYGGVNK